LILGPDAPGRRDHLPWHNPIHFSKREGVIPGRMPGREVREMGTASAPELVVLVVGVPVLACPLVLARRGSAIAVVTWLERDAGR
jgi:hypothetical protein